jgi:putative effector of murein hydrolase LrgA (UPF0299 family)
VISVFFRFLFILFLPVCVFILEMLWNSEGYIMLIPVEHFCILGTLLFRGLVARDHDVLSLSQKKTLCCRCKRSSAVVSYQVMLVV